MGERLGYRKHGYRLEVRLVDEEGGEAIEFWHHNFDSDTQPG